MNKPVTPLRADEDSVTLARADFERLVEAAEDAIDLAAVAAQEAREAELGVEAARADYLPIEQVDRLLAGESPVRVWREHRGLTLPALAEAAGIAPLELARIEANEEPASPAEVAALARILSLAPDDLVLVLGE